MTAFQGTNLQCIRGERLVFEGLDFALGDGDALVLTGPNGAGKSTLLRLMAGLLRPSAGIMTWDADDISEDPGAHNARLVYIGHADAVKPSLTVLENVSFWADVSGAGGLQPMAALEALKTGHLADLPARYLSAGQRRRVSLTRMLTSPAKLWLLDEPTTALDRDAAAALGALVARHREAGGMVVVSTHMPLGLDDPISLDLAGIAA